MIVPISSTAERVLRALARGPAKAKEIATGGLSVPTFYRVTKELPPGFVLADSEGYHTLGEKGQAWLDARDASVDAVPELPIPALAHAPSPEHRSFLELGMCGAVARAHSVADRSLPCFLLVGEPGSFKTTIGAALVALAGGNPETDVVLAAQATGKGLLVRRNARGEEIYRCSLLDVPVAVFDEMEKVEDARAAGDLANCYFGGTAIVNTEGPAIPLRCLPVGTMNPASNGARNFAELTDLHDSRERRVTLAQLPKVVIPKEKLDDDWFANLVAQDRDRTPKLPVPRNPGLKVAGRFRAIIDLVFKNAKAAERMDPHVLKIFACGATAWFDDERAMRHVAFHWTRLQATNGLCHDDWEERLLAHFAPEATKKVRRTKRVLRKSRPLYNAVKNYLDGDFDRALVILVKEGTLRRENPVLARVMEEIKAKVIEGFSSDPGHALFLLQLELELQKRGLSTRGAVAQAQRALDLGLTTEQTERSLELGAEILDRKRLGRVPPEARARFTPERRRKTEGGRRARRENPLRIRQGDHQRERRCHAHHRADREAPEDVIRAHPPGTGGASRGECRPLDLRRVQQGLVEPGRSGRRAGAAQRSAPNGEAVEQGPVREILHNQVYLGDIVWNRETSAQCVRLLGGKLSQKLALHTSRVSGQRIAWEQNEPSEHIVLKDRHPPIISRELFAKTRATLADRRTRAHQPLSRRSFGLVDLAFCANCGNRLMSRSSLMRGRTYRYYFCEADAGHATRVRADVLERAVVQALRSCVRVPGGRRLVEQRLSARALLDLEIALEADDRPRSQMTFRALVERVDVRSTVVAKGGRTHCRLISAKLVVHEHLRRRAPINLLGALQGEAVIRDQRRQAGHGAPGSRPGT